MLKAPYIIYVEVVSSGDLSTAPIPSKVVNALRQVDKSV